MYIKIEGNVNIKVGEIKIKTSIYNTVDIKFYMGCRQPISTCNENTQMKLCHYFISCIYAILHQINVLLINY